MNTPLKLEAQEEAIRFAGLVKSLAESHSYKLTIGAWLEEMRQSALKTLMYLPMGDQKIWQCQAELKVVDMINSRIQAQIEKSEHLRLKNLKREKEQ